MPDRPFPFRGGARTMRAMSTPTRPDAELTLRAPRSFVRPRLSWPPNGAYGGPIAVFLADARTSFDAADALCFDAGFVVLAIRTLSIEVATVAVEWAADHAEQLGANPERLLIAGGGLAAGAALHARDEGWPAVSRQLLIGPEQSGWPARGVSLAGAAAATVVNARGYAARLREAGVDVQELSLEPMSFDWIRGLRSDDANHEEPQSDHHRD
jgi:alpha/beta hydrolase fold